MHWVLGCLTCLLLACKTATSEPALQAETPTPAAVVARPAEPARTVRVVEDRSLARFLVGHGMHGVIALLDDEAEAARCSDAALCERAFVPASTYKIPNSIIGLETGVIADADFMLPWDGVTRRMAAWNQDHTLRTAIRDSAVWYYQELARRVGRERMQTWLHTLDYGNMQIGDAIDGFWLDGPLAIRPREQLAFLRKLARARLPISARTRSIVLDITTLGALDGQQLHGKTGWAFPDRAEEVGWFVGFARDPRTDTYRYVAVLVFKGPPEVDFFKVRRVIAEQALREG